MEVTLILVYRLKEISNFGVRSDTIPYKNPSVMLLQQLHCAPENEPQKYLLFNYVYHWEFHFFRATNTET
jgi:hypothetical protein